MKDVDQRTKSTSSVFKVIDLFCGAGGMTLGFGHQFGHLFEPIWANDFNKDSVKTYNLNFGNHCIQGDLLGLLNDPNIVIPEADVVIGGPPCQGFSLLNKERKEDPRRELWRPFLDVVERSGADVFVMENVPQLLDAAERDEIVKEAKRLGFTFVRYAKLMAADYGVGQIRTRAFIVGCRFADPADVFPPARTHYNPRNGCVPRLLGYETDARPWLTVKDEIADLPVPEGTEIRDASPPLNLHFGRNPTPKSVMRYKAIPTPGMNRFDLQRLAFSLTPACWIRKTKGGTDLFGRLWWDRPAFTIRTDFFKPEKGRYLHPDQHRPITHREAARFQSFPDTFVFTGSKIEIAKQIGNAVPPRLASALASCVEELIRHGR